MEWSGVVEYSIGTLVGDVVVVVFVVVGGMKAFKEKECWRGRCVLRGDEGRGGCVLRGDEGR